jgi:hypothetical protein
VSFTQYPYQLALILSQLDKNLSVSPSLGLTRVTTKYREYPLRILKKMNNDPIHELISKIENYNDPWDQPLSLFREAIPSIVDRPENRRFALTWYTTLDTLNGNEIITSRRLYNDGYRVIITENPKNGCLPLWVIKFTQFKTVSDTDDGLGTKLERINENQSH